MKINWHDFYVIGKYENGSFENYYSLRVFSHLKDAKSDLNALKKNGESIAIDRYDSGLFIAKKSMRTDNYEEIFMTAIY